MFAAVFALLETTSPGFAVPEASTMSLVLPEDGGLNGAGPEEEPARSQGFGGGVAPEMELPTGEGDLLLCMKKRERDEGFVVSGFVRRRLFSNITSLSHILHNLSLIMRERKREQEKACV